MIAIFYILYEYRFLNKSFLIKSTKNISQIALIREDNC